MIRRTAIVKNKLGIHARPAALLVRAASKFQSEIFLTKDTARVDGKSIMGVMMLAAGTDSEIVVEASGADEKKAVQKLAAMVESDFEYG